MPTNYPAGTDSLTNPAGTTLFTGLDHAAQHANANDAIEAIEATVGTTGGTNIMRNAVAGDFGITANSGGTFQQALFNLPVTGGTLKNVTLGTPIITGFAQNTVPGSALATSAITLGTVQQIGTVSGSTSTSINYMMGTVTVPSGGRLVKISAFIPNISNTTSLTSIINTQIWNGTVTTGTKLMDAQNSISSSGANISAYLFGLITAAAGNQVYSVGVNTGAGTYVLTTTAVSPAYLVVELI